MSTTVAVPQYVDDEVLEFPFRGASEADGTATFATTAAQRAASARPAKRRAVWLQCFAPRVNEPPSPPRPQAGPSVSGPSSAMSRVALSSDVFLYARPTGPMRLPFKDIAGAQLKWIEVGGARASKVIVSRKGGMDPLYIRGLKDPEAFVEALNRRLQGWSGSAGSVPTTATSSGGTVNTSEAAVKSNGAEPAESAGATKQTTARQLFPGQGADIAATTAPAGVAAAGAGATITTAAVVNGSAHPEITPADSEDEVGKGAVQQPERPAPQAQPAEAASSEIAAMPPQEQQAQAASPDQGAGKPLQELPPEQRQGSAPALAASQPLSTPPEQPGVAPPLGYSQSVPSTFSSIAAAATAAAAAAAARDRASTGGAGGVMTSLSPFANSPAQQSAVDAIHASPSSPSMVLAVNPHRRHHALASGDGAGSSADRPAAAQRRVSAPGQSPLGAIAPSGSTSAPESASGSGPVKQQERPGPPPPPPVPEDSFTESSAAWARSGKPVVTATAMSTPTSTATSSAAVRYSPLLPPPVPAESYTFPPSSSGALSLPPLSVSAPRFVAGGPPPPMAEDSIMPGADSCSRPQPTAISPQASTATGPAAAAPTAAPTPVPARGSSLIQVSSLSPALGVAAAPAAASPGTEVAAVAAGVGAMAGAAAAEAATARRPAVSLEPPAWTPGQESPESTPRLQATPPSSAGSRQRQQQQRSPDVSSPARGLGGGGLPDRRPSRSASARGSEHGSSGSPAAAASTRAAAPNAAEHTPLPQQQRSAQAPLALDYGSSLAATVVAPLTLIGLSAVAAMTAVAASAVVSFNAAALASPGAPAYSALYQHQHQHQYQHQLRDGGHPGVHIRSATPTAASGPAQREADGDGAVEARGGQGREAAFVAESGEGAWSVAASTRRRRPLQLTETPVRVLFSVPQAGDVEAEAAGAVMGSIGSPAPQHPRFTEAGMQTEPERVSAATSPMRPATASAAKDSPRLSESPTHRAYVHDGRPVVSAGVSSLSGPAAASSPVFAELAPGADAAADEVSSAPRGARDWYMTSTSGAAMEPRAGSFDLRGASELNLPSPTASYSSSSAVAGASPAAAAAAAAGLTAAAVAGAAAYGASADSASPQSVSYPAGHYGPAYSEGVSLPDSQSLATASPSGEVTSSAFAATSRSAPGPAHVPMPVASGSPSTSSARSAASQTTTSACTHGPVPPTCAFVGAVEEAAAAAASPSAGGVAAGHLGPHARLGGVGSEQSSSLSPSVSATSAPSSVASALYTPMASGAGSAGSGGIAGGAAAGAPRSAHTSAVASPSDAAAAAAGAAFFGDGSPQWTHSQQQEQLLPSGDYTASTEAPTRAAAQSGGGSLSQSLSLRAGTSAGGTHASAAATASAGMAGSPRPTALPDMGFPENAEDCTWLLAPAASATVNNESEDGSAPTPTASAAAAARSARSSPFTGNAALSGAAAGGSGAGGSGGSPGGAGVGDGRARGGSGTSSRRSSSGSCGSGGGGGGDGGGCGGCGGGGGARGGSDPTWAFMEETGRMPDTAGAHGANAAFARAAAPPMSPGLSEISSTAYGVHAGGNMGVGYWHSGVSSTGASPFGTPSKPTGVPGAAAGAATVASPAPAPFVNPLFVTPSKDARASGRSIERSDSGGDIALPLLPYGGAAAVAAAAAAGYTAGAGRRTGTGGGDDGDDDGSLSYTSSAGPSTYAGSVGAAGPVPGAAGGSGSATAAGAAAFGTPQGPAGAAQPYQQQQQQQLNPQTAWTGAPPQWKVPGLPHASPLMVLNPMYAQEQAAAASSSSAAQSAAVSPGVDAAADPAFAATARSPPQQQSQSRQLPLGWGSPAFASAGSGSGGGGSQSTPLGWGSPTFPAAPASPARTAQQQYQPHPQQQAAWSTPQQQAYQAPMLFAGTDVAAGAAAGVGSHADAQAIVTPRQACGSGGEGLMSTPKQQQLPQSSGSQLTSPMSSVQGSPNSQQAKHAAALLRNANDAVGEARTLVSRGDEAWLQHVAETLAAVQSAIDALKWQ